MEQVAQNPSLLVNETENLLMSGKIVNKVPELLAARGFTDHKEASKELMFGARMNAGTASFWADPESEPNAIYFDVLLRMCNFFDCEVSDIIEYVPGE